MFIRLFAFAVGAACLVGSADRIDGQDKKDPKDKKADARRWDLAGFVKKVEPLPAEEQLKAVLEKLQELNTGFREFRGSKIEDGVVTRLSFDTSYVLDLSPVRALAGLKDLEATPPSPIRREGKVLEIDGLRGLKLERLVVSGNPAVPGIAAVKGMPLVTLECAYTKVADLAPLEGCATLEVLNCDYTAVSSLKPLKGLPKLRHVLCSRCKGPTGATIADITPLQDMKLEKLDLAACSARDFAVIKTMPIKWLNLSETPIADFSVLKPLPLTELFLERTRLTEKDGASFLKGKPLKAFNAAATTVRDIKFLKGMPLTSLDLRGCTQLPNLDGVEDSRELTWLRCSECPVKDLKPVARLPLVVFFCENTKVADLEPLKGAPLEALRLSCDPKFIKGVSPVADLSPLAEMKLTSLTLENTSVKDLKPLTGQPLDLLYLDGTQVKDLKPLAGSPIRVLWLQKTPVADLTPLKELPKLEDLKCDFQPKRDAALLKQIKTLKTLNGMDPGKLLP